MTRTMLAVLAGAALAAASTPAGATGVVIVTDETFYFTGVCSDCSGDVSATLVLQNYTLGDEYLPENFVSFTYGGSNLLPGFTVTPSELGVLFGTFATVPGANNTYIVFTVPGVTIDSFTTGADGTWSTGTPGADYGTSGSWSNTSVPEPATWAMMGLGFAGLALAGYQARKRTVAVA